MKIMRGCRGFTSIGIFALLTLSGALRLHAQPRLGLYTGANFPASTIHFGELDHSWASFWYLGINLGASMAFPVADGFEVGPVFECNHYSFHKYLQITTEAPPWKGSGEASHVYRLGCEAHLFHEKGNHNRIYLTTGLGYMIERKGVLTRTYYGEYSTHWQLPDKDYWAHSVGLGYQIALSRSLALDLCAKYYANYNL